LNQYRVAALLGPVLVLYLVAQGAAGGATVDAVNLVIIALACAVSMAPLFVLRPDALAGARRVALLSGSAAAVLAANLWPGDYALLPEVVNAAAIPLGAAALLSLSAAVPDVPSIIARKLWILRLGVGAVMLSGWVGLLAVLPPVRVAGGVWLAPAWALSAPQVGGFLALAVATVLRLLRRRLGSDARALAANMWAALGCLFALSCALVLVALPAAASGRWSAGLWALLAVSLSGGHLWLVDAKRALVAGPLGRAVLATSLTLGIVAAAAAFGTQGLPPDTFARTLVVFGALLGAYALRSLLSRAVRWIFAPERGRLLDALDEIDADLADSRGFEDLVARVLRPLRRAVTSPEAAPALYCMNPDTLIRLDAAGQTRCRARQLPSLVLSRLAGEDPAPLLLDELRPMLVRHPEHRELVAVLEEMDALAILPLRNDDALEGALLVARGQRRTPLTLEELSVLTGLCQRLTPFVSAHGAEERAHARAHQAVMAQTTVEEKLEGLEDEIAQLRADARTYAGAAAGLLRGRPVAYSRSMRELTRSLLDIAPHDVPLLIVAEAGCRVETLAQQVHDQSGRAEGPLIVGASAHSREDQLAAALFGKQEGEGREPGWLRLSSGGTLLLMDIGAVPMVEQLKLAEALSDRQARPVDGAGAYPVTGRLLATSRVSFQELQSRGMLHELLAQRLEGTVYTLPALRDRTEDLQSLVLMAIDRAARVLGRDPVGIEPAAMEVLGRHSWPLNLLELESVIERAVETTPGTQIRVVDLPDLTGGVREPLDHAPFYEQERAILVRAMQATEGNLGEAARRLGLQRAVFLDKLRRHELDDSDGPLVESN